MNAFQKLLVATLAFCLVSIGTGPVEAVEVETSYLISASKGSISISIASPKNAECKTVNDKAELVSINNELDKAKDALARITQPLDAAKEQITKSRTTLNMTTNAAEKLALSAAIQKLANAILTLTNSRQKLVDQITGLESKKKEISEKLAASTSRGDSYEVCTVPIELTWDEVTGNVNQQEMQRFSLIEVALGMESEDHQILKYENQVAILPFVSGQSEGSFNGEVKLLKNDLATFSIGLNLGAAASTFQITGGVVPEFTSIARTSPGSSSLALTASPKTLFGLIFDAGTERWLDPKNRDNQGKCKYGFIEDDSTSSCIRISWKFSNENDGFSKWISLTIDSAEDEFTTGDESQLEITCTRKKLAVNVYFEFPDSFGWKGTGLFRIDNGPGKKFVYTVDKSISYIWVDSPKVLTSSLMKSKEKVSFRLVNSYARILAFPKSDLSNWAGKFKSAGCSLT